MPAWGARLVAVVVVVVATASTAVGVAGAAASALADREDLVITVKPREPRPDVFVLKGKVEPDYRKQDAVLQRRNCGSCAWYAFERFRTDGESRFKLRVPTPGPEARKKVCYRVKIARSADYRRALSAANCIDGVVAP